MHEDRLVFFDGVLDEVEDGLRRGILLVEDHGRFEVHPLERQVSDAAALPVVGHLLAGAVDDVSHFVRDNKLLVLHNVSKLATYLGCETITDEQAVLDFDGADHVLGKGHHALVHHLVHLHLHHLVLHLHLLLLSRWSILTLPLLALIIGLV